MDNLKLDGAVCQEGKMEVSSRKHMSNKLNDIGNLIFQNQNGTSNNKNGFGQLFINNWDNVKNPTIYQKFTRQFHKIPSVLKNDVQIVDEDALNKFVSSTLQLQSQNGLGSLVRPNTDELIDYDLCKTATPNKFNLSLSSIKDFNRINSISPTNSVKSIVNSGDGLSLAGSILSSSSSSASPNRDTSCNNNYNNIFQNSQESMDLLRKIFKTDESATPISIDEALKSLNTGNDSVYQDNFNCDDNLFEWLPDEPQDSYDLSTADEIHNLLQNNYGEQSLSPKYDYSEHFFVSSYQNHVPDELITKINNLTFIHESLHASSDFSTLVTLEKFLAQLLQPQNYYGELTPHGRLLTFINLSFLQKHLKQLNDLYNHPEMSTIRTALNDNKDGEITNVLNKNSVHEEEDEYSVDQMPKFIKSDASMFVQAASHIEDIVTNKNKPVHAPKSEKQKLTVLDSIAKMYKPGGEPHFPRYVCGTVDRTWVTYSETICIPFDKSEKRSIHVQFEKIDCINIEKIWPKVTLMPSSIGEGTKVQVAPLKNTTHMYWKEGVISSINSGQVMINILSDPKPFKERMYILRNFIPPNVPIVRMEKGYWRLMPRRIDLKTDIYIGSCLTLLDSTDVSSDVVITNIYYNNSRTLVGLVKSPSDETLFGIKDDVLDRCTCSCNGHTLRIFEGKCTKRKPIQICVHYLHDKRERVIDLDKINGFKLNYDIQSHFDGVCDSVPKFVNSLWVVPRNIESLGVEVTPSHKPGHLWLFTPKYCLVLFPFSRGFDPLQDFCKLIPFLHPEFNYNALSAGLWTLRSSKKDLELINEVTNVQEQSNLQDGLSYTRSQKAAIRDLTNDDVVTETCFDLINCPFPLIQRLLGCYPVISLWIILDSYNPINDISPEIPSNIIIPKQNLCKSCGGKIIPHGDLTKLMVVNNEESKYVPVLVNIERTEELVKRMQLLSICRWRITRDFMASHNVDDDITITTKSPTIVPIKHNNNNNNHDFINKLTSFMSDIKKTKDNNINNTLFTTACDLTSEIYSSNVENALLNGWTQFINEQNKEQDKPKDNKRSNNTSGGDKSSGSTSSAKYLKVHEDSAFKQAKRRCISSFVNNAWPDDELKQISAFNNQLKSNYSSSSSEYLKNLSFLSKLNVRDNNDITNNTSRHKEQYVDDIHDFCGFNDKSPRRSYIDKLKWDEDREYQHNKH